MSNAPRLELTTVRGIACIALVAYHVIGPTDASGLGLPASSFWHFAVNSFDFLRMPLFTVLSGFLYAANRASAQTLREFYRKKIQRIVIPLVFVTCIVFVLRSHVYHDPVSIWHALFFHYEHLWFLQALALIFLVIAAWDSWRLPGWTELCIASVFAVIISRSFAPMPFLSFNGALYLFPFFAMGMVMQTRRELLALRELSRFAAGVVVIVIAAQVVSHIIGGNEISRYSMAAALCGVSGAYLMLVHCPRMAIASAIGNYSYTIYLWHTVAESGARHALRTVVTLPTFVEFAILLAVGLVAPIVLHRVVERVPILSLLFAGVRVPTGDARPSKSAGADLQPAGPSIAWPARSDTGKQLPVE